MHTDPDESPFSRYQSYLKQGILAYQWDPVGNLPVFYPRLAAPHTGNRLEWRASEGLGIVHATTYIPRKDGPAYNVAIVEMAEGIRLMSRVEGIPADAVQIGMAVTVRVAEEEDGTLLPVFVPVGDP